MASGQGGQAAANHFGDVCRGEHGDHDDHPQDQVELGAGRQEVVEQQRRGEQQGDQRNATHELDEGHAHDLDQRHRGLPAEGKQDAQGQRQPDPGHTDDDREQESAKLAGGHGRQRKGDQVLGQPGCDSTGREQPPRH
ncbi:hypothetical protein D9M70_600020 [compost metagenome]